MNINYDEIITKANERAEKLKAIQKFAVFVEENANALISSLEYFRDFEKLVTGIDSEGRAMLGQTFYRVTRIGGLAGSLLDTYTTPNLCNGSDEYVLTALVEALK